MQTLIHDSSLIPHYSFILAIYRTLHIFLGFSGGIMRGNEAYKKDKKDDYWYCEWQVVAAEIAESGTGCPWAMW